MEAEIPPVEPPLNAVGPTFNVWDVQVGQISLRPRKRLKYRVLLLG
jgi:hypothetical protein